MDQKKNTEVTTPQATSEQPSDIGKVDDGGKELSEQELAGVAGGVDVSQVVAGGLAGRHHRRR